MKTIMDQMLSYSAYHRDFRNKISHFIGVPLIVYALFIPLGWFHLTLGELPLTGATLFYLGVFLYYLRLDWSLALVQLPFSGALLYYAHQASQLPFDASLTVFLASFIGGWIVQLIGHGFEGRRPALVDNLWQIFNAPLFLVLEVLFALGLRKEMRLSIGRALRAEPGPGLEPGLRSS